MGLKWLLFAFLWENWLQFSSCSKIPSTYFLSRFFSLSHARPRLLEMSDFLLVFFAFVPSHTLISISKFLSPFKQFYISFRFVPLLLIYICTSFTCITLFVILDSVVPHNCIFFVSISFTSHNSQLLFSVHFINSPPSLSLPFVPLFSYYSVLFPPSPLSFFFHYLSFLLFPFHLFCFIFLSISLKDRIPWIYSPIYFFFTFTSIYHLIPLMTFSLVFTFRFTFMD